MLLVTDPTHEICHRCEGASALYWKAQTFHSPYADTREPAQASSAARVTGSIAMSIDENKNEKKTGGAPVLWRSRPSPRLTSWCGLPRWGLGRLSGADDPRRMRGQFAQGI